MEGDQKPVINLSVLNTKRTNRVALARAARVKGNTRNSLNNNGSYFRNAKPASRAEEGLKLHEGGRLSPGTQGIIEISDGPRIKVTVLTDYHVSPEYKGVYTFAREDGTTFDMEFAERYTVWDFYTFIEPVPFVARTRKQRKSRKQRKTQRKYA